MIKIGVRDNLHKIGHFRFSRQEANRDILALFRRNAWDKNVVFPFWLGYLPEQTAHWCIFARRLCLARKAELTHGFDTLQDFRASAKKCWVGIDKPQAVASRAVDEFLRTKDRPYERLSLRLIGKKRILLIWRENQVAAVSGLVAVNHLRHVAERLVAALHDDIWRVDKVAVDMLCGNDRAVGIEDCLQLRFIRSYANASLF